jgi:hypothetical protein
MSCKSDFMNDAKVCQQLQSRTRFKYPSARTVSGFTLFIAFVIVLDTVLFSRDRGFESIVESFAAFSHLDLLTLGCFACFLLGRSVMGHFAPQRTASSKMKEHRGGFVAPAKGEASTPSKMEAEVARSPVARRNQLIDQAARSGDVAKAGELLIEFEESGGQPDVVSYNLCMRACARAGDVKGAENWLQPWSSAILSPRRAATTRYWTLVRRATWLKLARSGWSECSHEIWK